MKRARGLKSSSKASRESWFSNVVVWRVYSQVQGSIRLPSTASRSHRRSDCQSSPRAGLGACSARRHPRGKGHVARSGVLRGADCSGCRSPRDRCAWVTLATLSGPSASKARFGSAWLAWSLLKSCSPHSSRRQSARQGPGWLTVGPALFCQWCPFELGYACQGNCDGKPGHQVSLLSFMS